MKMGTMRTSGRDKQLGPTSLDVMFGLGELQFSRRASEALDHYYTSN